MIEQAPFIKATEQGFKGNMLDTLLSFGYYRMQHLMFTCNETQADGNGYSIPVFWLRTLLQKVQPKNTGSSISRKCANFSVNVMPAVVTDEIEELYHLYRNHVPFSTAITCSSYLHQDELPNPFDSMMVTVHDEQKLIAVGFFDKGLQAIAGIMNIYHPAYQKYSLGKFLILQKIQYAISQNMVHYYTGYISTGSTRFDYKTFPTEEAVEVYLPIEKRWVAYSLLGKDFLQDYYINYLV